MSTASQIQSTPTLAVPSRKQMWRIAAISPVLFAPIWLALPQQTFGALRTFSGLLLVLLLVSSTVTDLSQRKIFNWTTYTACVWALAINALPSSFASTTGAIGLSNSLPGASVCFLVMLFPYMLARGGAGDVKLATAIGALTGAGNGLLIIAFAYIVAATTIIGWTVWTKGPLNLLSAMLRRVGAKWLPQFVLAPTQQQNLLLDKPIPLAGFFAIATLLVVFDIPVLLRSL